jgi:hypothetical protein
LERGAWLCEIDVKKRELTKAEYRALRQGVAGCSHPVRAGAAVD